MWKEAGGRWAIQIEIDGAFYTERDYSDAASASHAIAQILRQHAERSAEMDEEACEECERSMDLLLCSQCGVDAFVRTCRHAGSARIRLTEGAHYCRACRP